MGASWGTGGGFLEGEGGRMGVSFRFVFLFVVLDCSGRVIFFFRVLVVSFVRVAEIGRSVSELGGFTFRSFFRVVFGWRSIKCDGFST